MSCPKSYISAQSLAWIEEYGVWQRYRESEYTGIEAKKLDAFLLIEAEIAAQKTER